MERQYIAIDLKSFYASVECVERGLDPLDTNLVVADLSRTEKTICLAVSPALKTLGTGGRPRLLRLCRKSDRPTGQGVRQDALFPLKCFKSARIFRSIILSHSHAWLFISIIVRVSIMYICGL